MTKQEQIARLIEDVHGACGQERALVCARDCLLEWHEGGDTRLFETVEAWNRFIEETRNKEGHTDCERHGAWVPALPL